MCVLLCFCIHSFVVLFYVSGGAVGVYVTQILGIHFHKGLHPHPGKEEDDIAAKECVCEFLCSILQLLISSY